MLIDRHHAAFVAKFVGFSHQPSENPSYVVDRSPNQRMLTCTDREPSQTCHPERSGESCEVKGRCINPPPPAPARFSAPAQAHSHTHRAIRQWTPKSPLRHPL